MSPKKGDRPIIVVKRVKRADHQAHGGAWKVAYADFVTSMMAFFMVMWLIASVDKDQRAAIFNYFKNPSMEQGKSVRPSPGQMGPGGASTSVIQLGGALDQHSSATPLSTGLGIPRPLQSPRDQSAVANSPAANALDEAKRLTEAAEHKKLESLMAELRQAIDQSQALKPFKDQLLLDITPEGLRIQIVDAQNRPMFDLGSAKLKPYTATILHELAPYLEKVPNRVSLSGHTDTTPYLAQVGYNNWDLSADRANAARRALESGGLAADKVARIVGLSSAVLFDGQNPRAPVNRRISIIVMTKQAEEAAMNSDTAPAVSGTQLPSAAPGPSATGAAAPTAPAVSGVTGLSGAGAGATGTGIAATGSAGTAPAATGAAPTGTAATGTRSP
jgi:chemotaxis protein MotB